MNKSEIRSFIDKTFYMDAYSDDDLLREEGVDSTGFLDIILFIEETYDITVEDNEITPDNLESINKIKIFIEGKTK